MQESPGPSVAAGLLPGKTALIFAESPPKCASVRLDQIYAENSAITAPDEEKSSADRRIPRRTDFRGALRVGRTQIVRAEGAGGSIKILKSGAVYSAANA
jgi:hypothetical protein